jgi:DNA-binding beta-propeller fold protein YncE
MNTNKYLFPHRLTRRDFFKTTGTATASMMAMGAASATSFAAESTRAEAKDPVRVGSGRWTYEADLNWGKLPAGMKYGFGCGIVVDSQDRIYVTSRSDNPAVAVFDPAGNLLETWSNDFADKVGYSTQQVVDSAHCLYWSKEKDGEFFYFTENAGKNGKDPSFGRRVYKTDLKGKILFEIGNVAKEGTTSQKFEWTNPTDVAVAPNGDIYVVDGYGSQRVTHFDKNFKEIKTIGKRGAGKGEFNICHGVWVSTLHNEPEVYIADRANGRLHVFDLDLNFKRELKGDYRLPCCLYQHDGHLYVPDLGGVVTMIDPADKVVAHLGDGKRIDGKTDKPNNQTDPALFATPHAITVDSKGNFYTVEWLPFGRPRKFRHVPQAA